MFFCVRLLIINKKGKIMKKRLNREDAWKSFLFKVLKVEEDKMKVTWHAAAIEKFLAGYSF